jgi:hypothetical protein
MKNALVFTDFQWVTFTWMNSRQIGQVVQADAEKGF